MQDITSKANNHTEIRLLHLLPSLNDFGVKPRNCVSYSCSLATLCVSSVSLTSLDTLRALTLLLTLLPPSDMSDMCEVFVVPPDTPG